MTQSAWSFKKFVCRVVLFTFYFQTLWPSVCFAEIDIPLGSPWRTPYQNITFAVKHKKDPTTQREALHLQAYVEREPFDQEQSHDPSQGSFDSRSRSTPFVSSTPLTSPSSSPSNCFSAQDAQGRVKPSKTILLNRILDRQTHQDIRLHQGLYQSLGIREEGVVWQFEGLTFVADWQGSLLITGQSTMPHLLRVKSSKDLLLDGLQADQVVAKAHKISLDGQGTSIERLDVWAKQKSSSDSSLGHVVISPAAQVFMKHLSIHTGNLDQQGQLYVEQGLKYQDTVKNKGQLVFGKGAVINGQGTFLNYGAVQGEAYTLNSKRLKTFGVSAHNSKVSTLTATNKLTVNSDVLTHTGTLNAPSLDLNIKNKLITAKGSQIESADFRLNSQGHIDHQGTLKAARSSVTADTLNTSSDSVIHSNFFYTTLQQHWHHHGKLQTNYWIDKSPSSSLLNNQGSIVSRKGTKITGQFKNLNTGKADLAKTTFLEQYSFFKTLTNAGDLTLRNVQSLGQPPYGASSINVHNKKGAILAFIDCGTLETPDSFIAHSGMSPLNNHFLSTTTAKTKTVSSKTHPPSSPALPQARLMLGNVTNEGTIRFSNGAYQIDGTFTNKAEAIHQVLDLQNLWVKDFVNEGRVEASTDYRLDQRLGVFKQAGHLTVKSRFRGFGKNKSNGQLITQLTKQALGSKSKWSTSWTHTGHIEADEWIDESESGILLKNEGTLLIHKKATLNTNFKNEQTGTADLTGLKILLPAASVFGSRHLDNEGSLTLRQIKSLGSAQVTVFNKTNAKLTFLDCGYGKSQQSLQTAGTYPYFEQDDRTGGLSFNSVYNWGTVGFGGGDYHIDYFKNYGIHEVLAGHHLYAGDFNNKGETRAKVPEYIIDQTNGLFSRLGKINAQGDVRLKFPDEQDIGAVLFNSDNQFNLKGKLTLQGDNLTVPAGQWTLNIPLSLHLQGILKILGRWTTNDLTARIGDYTQIGERNQLGALQVKGKMDLISGGYINNRHGQIEISGSGKIQSKNGYIYIGEHLGGYAAYGQSFILGHEDLEIDSAHEIHNICADIASYGPMTLRAKGKVYNLSSRTQSHGALNIHTPVLQNHRPGLVAFEQRGGNFIREKGYRSMGEQSMIYSAEYLYLDIQDIENLASSIQTHGIIMNGRIQVIDVTEPQNYFRSFINQSYNGPSDNYPIIGRFANKPPCSIAPIYQPAIITSSSGINLNFNQMTLTGGAMAGAFINLMGQYLNTTWSQSSTSKPTQSLTTRFSLYPYLSPWTGGSMTYQTPNISPKVAFGSALSRHSTLPFADLTFVVDDIHQFDPLRDFNTYRLMMNTQMMGMVYATAMNQVYHRGGMFAHQSGDQQVQALLRQTRQVFGGQQVITKQQAESILQHALTLQLQTINGEQMWTPYLTPGLSERDHRLAQKDGAFNATNTDLNMEMKQQLDLHGTTASAKGKLIGQAKVIDVSSTTQRQGYHDNYSDHLKPTTLEGESIEVDGDDHVQLAATHTHSGKGGTRFTSNGTLHDGAVALHRHQHTASKRHQTTTHTVNQATSSHQSEGAFEQIAQDILTADAHNVTAKSAHLHGGGGVTVNTVHHTTETHSSSREKGGLFKGDNVTKEHSFSSTSQGAQYNTQQPTVVTSGKHITLRQAQFNIPAHLNHLPSAILQAPLGDIYLLAGQSSHLSSRYESSAGLIQTTVTQDQEMHQTRIPCSFNNGVIINGKQIHIQKVKDEALQWLNQMTVQQGVVHLQEVANQHHYHHTEQTRISLSPGIAAVVALGVTALTGGMGAELGWTAASTLGAKGIAASVISGMTAAAFTAVCAQASLALLNNEGDLTKAAKSLTQSNSFKAVAISAATAGLTRGLAQQLGIKLVPGMAETTLDHFQKEVLRNGVSMSLNMATGSDAKTAIEYAIRGTIAGVAGGLMANQIGAMKQEGTIDPVTHKALHGMVGAMGGAILNQGDNLADSMMAGAIGAATAETIAEAIKEDAAVIAQRVEDKAIAQGIDLTDKAALAPIIMDEMSKVINVSVLGGAIATMLAEKDVGTAIVTGTIAVENNFAKALIGAVIYSFKVSSKTFSKVTINFTEGTKKLLGKTNKLKEQLFERIGKSKTDTTLRAAQKELKGEQIPLAQQRGKVYNHIQKVEDTQNGLLKLIEKINDRLSHPNISTIERSALQQELSQASKLLDHTETFVPRLGRMLP